MHTMEQGVDDSGRDQDAGNGENLLEAETRAPSLPGYLPWEQDLQMVSTFLDKKVQQSLATFPDPPER